MSKKSYLRILQGGILVSFLILLFVFSGFLFPFITSKQLTFNILMEVLLAIFLIFIIKYPEYAPKKSQLTWAIIIYFLTIIASLFVSFDFNLSFWGDLERMLGLFHLLHFFIFYIITISVFRSKNDFKLLFHAIIISSLMVVLYAWQKNNPDSSIGNRAYVAAMMLFALFLQVMYLLRNPKWWAKVLYGLGIILAFIGFIKADISGSQAGLLAGIFVALLVFVISSKNKNFKIIGTTSLLAFLALIIILFAFRSHSVFDGTFIGKALRDFSSQNTTLNTRLISYRSAFRYLADHPLALTFGVGHGNYAIIFDKYFSAQFFNFDRVGTYFDRAHNTLIDILTTTGLIGLLAYAAIFIFILYFLIRAYQKRESFSSENRVGQIELSLLLGLVSAYFVQNLAVFDSFATYLYFFSFLAYIYFLEINLRKIKKNEKSEEKSVFKQSDLKQENLRNNKCLRAFKNTALVIVFVLLIFSFVKNIQAIQMTRQTIDAYILASSAGIVEANDEYEKLFKFRSGLERDARESFINLALEKSDQIIKHKDLAAAQKTIAMLLNEAGKNLAYNQYDNMKLSQLSKVYLLASRFALEREGDSERAAEYNALALHFLDRSIESSPERVPLYLNKVNLLLNSNREAEALEILEKAKALNPEMPDTFCQLAHYYFVRSEHAPFMENLASCAEKNGFKVLNWGNFLSAVESQYYQEKDFPKLIEFYELILPYHRDDARLHSNLTLAYYENGDLAAAEEMAEKLAELDPAYKEEAEGFINHIRQEREGLSEN